ncbi:hypothetical protein B0T21DRAFT_22595 [Apiosordaria backusii]|uniref:Uncharacterized protein n=1 Tax=Apiosordaria backusii TaxID=314023 RepID=A0AA40K764_9PEZI|nr:hypothetical protein B0T21DRAFT_22595 [Apiosordaria backusii]
MHRVWALNRRLSSNHRNPEEQPRGENRTVLPVKSTPFQERPPQDPKIPRSQAHPDSGPVELPRALDQLINGIHGSQEASQR